MTLLRRYWRMGLSLASARSAKPGGRKEQAQVAVAIPQQGRRPFAGGEQAQRVVDPVEAVYRC